VDTIGVMLEGGELELPEGVADEPVTMLKDEILELEGSVVPWAGGTIVVFWAGHPEDPASRRTGQRYCRESMPFQTTAG
jgi:hypothetical protein